MIRISFSYKVYKGYPEATEISKIRGMLLTFYSIALGFGVLTSIALLTLDFIANWYIGIPGIIFSIIGFIYLVTRYNEVTERKVACAIYKHQLIEEFGITDSALIRKLMKEFKDDLKAKEDNDVPYDKMI